MASDWLAKLNEQQHQAVTAGFGPVLIFAGPGSGKTRVLTHRIAYLIGAMGVSPRNIMAVTFTNKAAKEMRERITHLLGERLVGLQVGTFHATCAKLLRMKADYMPFGNDYAIYDRDDQLKIVDAVLVQEQLDPKKFNSRNILNAISNAKNMMIDPDKFRPLDYFEEIVSRVYPAYQARLLASNAMDFDDLLLQMVELMQDNQTVREQLQEQYQFVLVDEFQDTNLTQYELVKAFGAPQNNIFVVGDEDQSIYAFRGADYRNVMQFQQDFPNRQTVILEQNYRSTQNILDTARAVIDRNRNRTPKKLFTDRQEKQKVTLFEAYDEAEEVRYFIQEIEQLRASQGYDYRDFAITYRTNAQSRAIESGFVRNNIPYVLVGGVGFYKRREVKDILSYLRFVNNPNDQVSFERVINTPKRGIGSKSIQKFHQWLRQEDLSYEEALHMLAKGETTSLEGRVANPITNFAKMFGRWRKLALENNLLDLLDAITQDTQYTFYLHDISDTPDQLQNRMENLQALRGNIIEAQQDQLTLTDFLTEEALVADVDQANIGEGVTLLTLHSAKGLEFPVVFVSGVEEGLIPHSRSFDEADGLEEERRLLYVGITRAMDYLYLTYTFRRALYYNDMGSVRESSRFLKDIPPNLLDSHVTAGSQLSFDNANFRYQTTWDAPSPSRLSRDLQQAKQPPKERKENAKVRSNIIPFSDHEKLLKYQRNMRVQHPLFGKGLVIDSKFSKNEEEVTVAFEDKKVGIKTLLSSLANFIILRDE